MSIVRALTQRAPQALASDNSASEELSERGRPDGDRREALRYACRLDASCQPITAAAGNRWPAQAIDISQAGVALILSRRFEPGAILAVTLAGGSDCSPLARVQQVSPHGVYWRIGCSWADPLTPEELHSLVGAPRIEE